jgi:hypothetical protein
VPDDRFGDLGPEEPRKERSAAERFEERDRTHPEPDAGPPEVPRPSSRYAWVVGVAFLVVVIVAGINAIPKSGESIHGPPAGHRMPAFASPLATSNLSGDANVCQRSPCPKGAGKVPACSVRSRDVFNICQQWARPVILTFIVDKGADCFPQVDRVQRALPRLRGINVATVYFSRADPREIRDNVRRRGWTMPVPVDADGSVTNLYRVAVCPTTVFADRRGRVRRTRLGGLTEDQVVATARRLR